jgi:hypothetical protein
MLIKPVITCNHHCRIETKKLPCVVENFSLLAHKLNSGNFFVNNTLKTDVNAPTESNNQKNEKKLIFRRSH